MREMKVRVWDDVLKEMLYSHVEQFDDMLGFRFEKHLETENPIYMWSTGLKDKNGKEVYEGDVFPPTERTRGEVTIVCYDSKQCGYKAVPLSLFKANAGNGGWTGYYLNQFSEVIGNIYENPELLKGDENA